MRLFIAPSLVAFALLGACGGAPPKPSETPAVPASPTATASVKATEPPKRATAGRGASEALARAWLIDEPRILVYADLEGLLKTKVFAGLVPQILALTGTLTAPQRTCIETLGAGVKEIAVGGNDGKHSVLIARLDPSAARGIGACFAAFPGSDRPVPITIEGAAQAWAADGPEILAVTPAGIMVFGDREYVARAIAGTSGGTGLKALALQPDEYVAWTFTQRSPAVTVRGTLLASDERFKIAGDAELPAVMAAMIESEMRPQKLVDAVPTPGLKPADRELLSRLLKSFALQRDGNRLTFAFDLHEPPADQARDLGALAALGIEGVRDYISKSKQVEARNTVGYLARSLVADWEKEDGKPRGKRKLVSYPAVPKTVPRGVKYQSTPADWKPWSPLHFEMTAPQYYQYEVKAAKDGESADIIARGDLNGDGKTSEFKMHVTIQRKEDRLEVPGKVDEKDPSE